MVIFILLRKVSF